MKFLDLDKSLKKERQAAYNIYGEDALLREKAVKKLLSLVTEFPDMNINNLGENAGALEIKEACELLPMMGGLRAVAAAPSLKKGGAEILDSYLKNPNPSTVLILLSGEEPLKDIRNLEPVNCDKLSSSAIRGLIAEAAGAAGVTVDESAALRLIDYCAGGMARITGELDKLSAWAGRGGKIDAEAVRLMVEPEAEYRIYQLADAAARGNGELCMRITAKCMADKLSPTAMLAGLYSHFRRLLYCAITKGGAEELAAGLGVKAFALENARRQAKLFSPLRLKKINDLCNNYETGIKSGKIYEYNALILALMFIINIQKQ